jgi:hypothetical protein
MFIENKMNKIDHCFNFCFAKQFCYAVVSSRASRDKNNADKFQDYFYESLTQRNRKLR